MRLYTVSRIDALSGQIPLTSWCRKVSNDFCFRKNKMNDIK